MDDVRYTLRQLEYFIAVANEGTITGAAERCLVSPTAVSIGLGELERALNTQLVLRQRAKGIALTAAGQQALISALSLVKQAEQFQSMVNEDEIAGKLTVGCYTTLSPVLMPTLMAGFMQQYPQIEFGLEENSQPELERGLLDGSLDLSFGYAGIERRELQGELLARAVPHVILSESHPLANEPVVSLRQLASEPMVLFDVSPSREDWKQMVHELDIDPVVAFRTKSFELTRCLVGQGFGYAVLVQRPNTPYTYDASRVVIKEIEEKPKPRDIVALYPDGMRLPHRVAAFLAYCKSRVPDLQNTV
ncbi:DNA-binding transcriptional LysR family regulator [Rhodococcus erythropolis]|uniref:LysR substrate-binding domain-containing protein n=1 Tax=Rhodococcus TaxID=1827 RepID=UPI0021695CA2|nr:MULTISPECIES: LysR substrate-binding domain-containing protein [Rhodococcus]MCS4253052.1 DNA-binding transcriptional LysR family regulator [Rhodococcus erythropolis]MCW2428503.1 DNA-binding transcriptional LysR family regulator [Rhodococcus erythropolis]MDV8128858.1 LysR substrate-binding domain-containing protein [Rhodococcus sp. IEGM 1304]